MLLSKGKGKVVFKKDWDMKAMSRAYDPALSAKLMERKSALTLQEVLLTDVTDRCFSRISNKALVLMTN